MLVNLSDLYEEAKDNDLDFFQYFEFIESKLRDAQYDRDSVYVNMGDNSMRFDD